MPPVTKGDQASFLVHLGTQIVVLRDALERAAEDSDYCFVCDCHPSHGHSKDCLLDDLLKRKYPDVS